MGKDKKPDQKVGNITIMYRVQFDAPDYDAGYKIIEVDGLQVSFHTTEDAKRWLRKHGEAANEYLIVQIKARVELHQETIIKLISTQSG